MSESRCVAADSIGQLERGIRLVERLDDEAYTRTSPHAGRGGVGPHLRHILDHYECLRRGLPEGRVDYDRRERDERIERDREAAMRGLSGVVSWLGGLGNDEATGNRPLLVKMCTESRNESDPVWSRSSLTRELQFLLSHTVHHYAVINLLLLGQGIRPDLEFGVAPSTLQHERRGSRPRAQA